MTMPADNVDPDDGGSRNKDLGTTLSFVSEAWRLHVEQRFRRTEYFKFKLKFFELGFTILH
jgi:hypothetical protein